MSFSAACGAPDRFYLSMLRSTKIGGANGARRAGSQHQRYLEVSSLTKACFINLYQAKSMHPSGAKAPFFLTLDGMAKAMPLQSTIYETQT